jgi:macrolide-specific efflux system membrane fusion protein
MITTSRKKIIVGTIILLAILGSGLAAKKFFFSTPKATFITADAVKMDLEECALASGTLKAFKTVAVGQELILNIRRLVVPCL